MAEQIAEPVPNHIADTVRQMADEIAEPEVSGGKQAAYEMAEPVKHIAEPDDDGDFEIEADGAFNRDRRLWNISTYKDRHGKLRAKRVLRFVTNPPKPDIGVVTPSLAAELDERRGRGRWQQSRDDADELKRAAELVADDYWRNRGARRNSKTVSKSKHAENRTGKRGVLSDSQADSQRAKMPDMQVKWPKYLE